MSELRRAGAIVAVVVALVASALLLEACGGGDDEDTAINPAPAAAPGGSAAQPSGGGAPSLDNFPPSFVECLAEQGIGTESQSELSDALHSAQGAKCFEALHGG